MHKFLQHYNKDLDTATLEEIHDTLAKIVAKEVVDKSDKTIANNFNRRTINYISIEFLIGNCLENNLWNMGWLDKADKILKKYNTSVEEIIKVENDAGLGSRVEDLEDAIQCYTAQQHQIKILCLKISPKYSKMLPNVLKKMYVCDIINSSILYKTE